MGEMPLVDHALSHSVVDGNGAVIHLSCGQTNAAVFLFQDAIDNDARTAMIWAASAKSLQAVETVLDTCPAFSLIQFLLYMCCLVFEMQITTNIA